MRPSLQELESISQLLLSSDEPARQLGLQLLLLQPEYVPAMRRELVLATVFAEETSVQQAFRQVLDRYVSAKIIEQQLQAFAIFRIAPNYNNYRKDSMELYYRLRDYENIRPDYEPLFCKQPFYLLQHNIVAECICEKLPREIKTAVYYYNLILKVLPHLADIRARLEQIINN